MELNELIYRRKSTRKFTPNPVDAPLLDRIGAFLNGARPLYPGIRTHWAILPKESVRFYLPWKTPQLVAFYSEPQPGYLENTGFILQQLDLYLQSLGLGSCWLGLGKVKDVPAPDGMEFVILVAFGHPEGSHLRATSEFQRKAMSEIADKPDPRLECARLAPSSTNSQPWYFVHEGDTIHACCSHAGRLRHAMLGTMNRIDMGIALAHLYIEHPDTFRFFQAGNPHIPENHTYIGSFTL